MSGQAGYFRVSMEAARFLASQSDGPELLAAFMVLWSHAYGHGSTRDRTAAGARAIRLSVGCTDYQAKRLLRDLLTLRGGLRGELPLVMRMKEWNALNASRHPDRKANADVYMLPTWGDECAYLPSLLVQTRGVTSPLARLCQYNDALPEERRDALLMLLRLYQVVDYGAYMGAPPEDFIGSKWLLDGETLVGDFDLNLGHVGCGAGLHFWIVQEDENVTVPWRVIESLFGDQTEQSSGRFFRAHAILDELGLITRVVVVKTQGASYPLWVFSPAYRDALANIGVAGDLGEHTYRAAMDITDIDPDRFLIQQITDPDRDTRGSGVFVCATLAYKPPTVVSTRCPRFHAPTPQNMDGLAQAAAETQAWMRRLVKARRAARAAA